MADNEDSSSSEGQVRQRSRRTTERFAGSSPVVIKSRKIAQPSGTGIKLGEISKIADKLSKVAVQDDAVKRLHRVLYGSDGTATTRKKEIRLWNGTTHETRRTSMAAGLAGAKSVSMLKDICGILSLASGGDRTSLEERILEFLVKPTGSTAPLNTKTRKKDSKKSPKKSSSSGFSNFLKSRFAEVKAQTGDSMTSRDISQLITMEWVNMTTAERKEFDSGKPKDASKKVQKVIQKPAASSSSSSSDDSGSSSDESSGSE
jgi:hypothetical protein